MGLWGTECGLVPSGLGSCLPLCLPCAGTLGTKAASLLCRQEGLVEVRARWGREQGAGDFLSAGFLGLRRKQKEGRCGEVALGGSCSWCAAGVGF